MEANSSFSDDTQELHTPTSSRSRKRKSTAARSTSPETVCITKRTKTDVKEEVLSDEEDEESVLGRVEDRKVKREEEEEEEDDENGGGKRGKKDTEFVARVRRVNRVKSEEVGDDECYQLRGWRSGRRWVL